MKFYQSGSPFTLLKEEYAEHCHYARTTDDSNKEADILSVICGPELGEREFFVRYDRKFTLPAKGNVSTFEPIFDVYGEYTAAFNQEANISTYNDINEALSDILSGKFL